MSKIEVTEDDRFLLGYSDDPAGDRRNADLVAGKFAQGRERQNRVARDLFVFLATSILWVVAIFLLLPWPAAPSTSSSATAAATTAMTAEGTMPTNEQGILKDMSRFHNVTSGAQFISCGKSSEEALAQGCEYDTLLNAWVPAQCLDQEWIEEYEDDGSWAAFADKNLTQRLAPQEMGIRDHYYTSIRDHVNHCAMLWRKQFWTLFEDRKAFDGVIVNSYHTEHCSEFLSNLMTMERTEPTLVRVAFSGCWIKKDGAEL